MKAAPRSRRHWIVKHASGFCATGKMMKRWKQRDSDFCPRCQAPEDTTHVWTCKGKDANATWNKSIEELRKWLITQKTLPSLTKVLCNRLTAWRDSTPPTVEPSRFAGVRDTIADQDTIGWQAALEGTIVIGWADTQQRYYEWIGSRKTGKRWVAALIRKMWDVTWNQWEHRNHILHDNEDSILIRQQLEEIQEQFALGSDSVTEEARILFQPGEQAVKEYRVEARAAWLGNDL
jgi:hypothetical protein